MTLLSRLLGRTGARTDASTAPTHVIANALTSAGFDGERGGDIRATIERALGDAGLMPLPGDVRGSVTGAPAGGTPATPPAVGPRGRMLRATFANAHGRRDYRLYLPVGHDGTPCPLLVMLHGCTQSPEDFAVGTGMNALADRDGFVVAYPEQVARANHAKCWNWFRPEDQRADAGEPGVLMGIVEQITHDHLIDRERVFVAGLSAGAAMAVVLAHAYPDRIRAVGVHSGLPYASAHDVPSALATMQGRHAPQERASQRLGTVPMIVFHGDKDRTVAPSNADRLMQGRAAPDRTTRESERVPKGHAYTRERTTDASGRAWLERWTVHGAGHAWSGGHPAGSYTDPAGPDASAEMVRFFLEVAGASR